jgi:DNA-directed RNA polymerase specialized sigma24 family protein
MLARKKMPLAKREDVVQETGLRLLGMWDKVDSSTPPWGLVVTIALNFLRDEARRHPEREILGAVPDLPESYDVERAGLARLELRRVRAAMTKMSDAQRSVLLSELGIEGFAARRGADATKMLRLRARRKLHALLETASASGAIMALRFRRLFGDVLPWARGVSSATNDGVAPVAASLIAFGLFAFPTSSSPFGIGSADGTLARPSVQSETTLDADSLASAISGATDAQLLARLSERGLKDSTAARESHRKARHGSQKSGGGNSAPRSTPYRVQVPVGGASVEVEAHVYVAGKGAEVGEYGTGVPVCLHGFHSTPTPQLSCTKEPPKSSVGVKADAKVGSLAQGVEFEID